MVRIIPGTVIGGRVAYKAQTIFNKVKQHLLKQRKKSVVGGTCAYRGRDGLACAVGALLTDREAQKLSDEGINGSVVHALGDFLPKRLQPHLDLLSDLQDVHDENHPRAWPRRLADIAFAYDLKA